MNTIQKVIEESLKVFDEMTVMPESYSEAQKSFYSEDHYPESPYELSEDKIKSHLSTTISNVLSAIEAEVEGKKDRFKCGACGGAKVGHTLLCVALTDIQSLLKSAKLEPIK